MSLRFEVGVGAEMKVSPTFLFRYCDLCQGMKSDRVDCNEPSAVLTLFPFRFSHSHSVY